ncbi:MAG: hypothetical protein V3V99_08690 [candidate division Zixibacteria bacterium]
MHTILLYTSGGMILGLLVLVISAALHSDKHPGWRNGFSFIPFSGKKEWFRSGGYLLHNLGSILFSIGIISSMIRSVLD